MKGKSINRKVWKDWSYKPDPQTLLANKTTDELRKLRRRDRKAAKKAARRARKGLPIKAVQVRNSFDISAEVFYASWEWKRLRFEVLKTYGAVCMCCGSTEKIVVDHIKSRRLHPELQLKFENLQVLCDDCNRGKGYTDETDFRPTLPAPELAGDELNHMRSIQ